MPQLGHMVGPCSIGEKKTQWSLDESTETCPLLHGGHAGDRNRIINMDKVLPICFFILLLNEAVANPHFPSTNRLY